MKKCSVCREKDSREGDYMCLECRSKTDKAKLSILKRDDKIQKFIKNLKKEDRKLFYKHKCECGATVYSAFNLLKVRCGKCIIGDMS